LKEALARLPLAAALASVLALRPRRRGTPKRQAPVIQTQIILAVVGAVVMLVVGTSLARAFGIVGAAGLVRHRAKIADLKDAGVMLSTLAIGLASGVGLWMLALFATGFIMVVLWVIESFEKARVRNDLEFSLRTASDEEVCYEVQVPLDKKTDRLSNSILKIDPDNATGVEWQQKKEKK
jgi:uncharacterized membrane protein YhiD involved in acid resistance